MGAGDLANTPAHAHSIQSEAQVSEGRGRSFDTGVHTLFVRGGQREKALLLAISLVTIAHVSASVPESHEARILRWKLN